MTISETTRRAMHTRLVEVLGMEVADSLMEYLPPIGWADVATKRDLDALAAATKQDLDAHRELTKRDLEALSAELRGEMRSGQDRFEIAITDKINQQTRTLLLGMSAMVAATISAVSALVSVSH